MQLIIHNEALKTLSSIKEFVDSKNTKGAGARWLKRFRSFVKRFAISHAQYALCHDTTLAQMSFSCIVYGNWVVVFKIENNSFVIYQIIHGSLLK